MKTINILFASIIAFASVQSASAQTGKEKINDHSTTQVVKVYGESGMCKKRIEKAATSIEGVQSAIWDVDKNAITIKYDALKDNVPDEVQKKIASIGHDTEKYKATDAAYQSLPDCCHYKRKP